MRQQRFNLILGVITLGAIGLASCAQADDAPLSMIVMDPLAAPLSCPCVEGYAQRDYGVLARHLEQAVGRKVQLTFGESLTAALKKTGGRADLVIGKDSVVRADAKAEGLIVLILGRLADQQGSTDQFGMIVVNRDDPAQELGDLKGYTIIFGPTEADEKHAAPLELLKQAGIDIPKSLTIDLACSDGACKVIDLGPKSKTAAVISSYAQPLLEGCGTIKKGDLRVVAKTAPVPFISAFASESLDASTRQQIQKSLLELTTQTEVLEAIESLVGFLPVTEPTKPAQAASITPAAKKK
jgi:ABC-type phosphate/phosphonate transport system substrate-binding protein